MAEAASDRRSFFNADLIRSKGINLTKQLDILAPFADAFAERTAAEFSLLGDMSVKVTVVSANTLSLTTLLQSEAGFDVVTPVGTVSCWRNRDRQFDNLMCEFCLGASSVGPRDDDAERPATAFEKKIRDLVSEKIANAVASALGEIGEHLDLSVKPRARTASRKTESALLCYSVRLLLNVFDAALEFEVFMSFAECMKLIGGEQAMAQEAPSASELVRNAPFSVEIFLKPDVVDVRQILCLVPGEVLNLNVCASTPVELRMNGKMVSLGSLSFDSTKGRIKILDQRSLPEVSKSSRDSIQSVG
jgi:flagellar motor switch protein FliM